MDSFDKLLLLLEEKKKQVLQGEEKDKVEFLDKLLKNKACFFELKADVAFNILKYLGVPDDKLTSFYYDLTSPEMFSKTIPQVRITNSKD